MFRTIDSFIEEYTHESNITFQLLQALTDETLQQSVNEDYRTISRLAWHLVPTNVGLLEPIGLQFKSPAIGSEPPSTAPAIAKSYREATNKLLDAIRIQWTDADLQQTANVYGFEWQHGYTLYVFLKHEIHHRGQLTVLMRQAGLPLVSVYGPTKEQWANFGMAAPV
ncbi:DinB family protein [Paenibacillus kobensis]|uniref:DinB family protein n=1 Tax=Paenibacillus kobensis TaxID=59841 RepID=UPI000FDBE031|nr:DinB family protein [Paenibacillus kobensis]